MIKLRRQVPIPDELYHITRVCYVESILEDGLIPCINKVARFDLEDGDESRMGVYLTSNVEAVLSADDSFNEPIYAVLSVNVRDIKNNLIPDDAYDGLERVVLMKTIWMKVFMINSAGFTRESYHQVHKVFKDSWKQLTHVYFLYGRNTYTEDVYTNNGHISYDLENDGSVISSSVSDDESL